MHGLVRLICGLHEARYIVAQSEVDFPRRSTSLKYHVQRSIVSNFSDMKKMNKTEEERMDQGLTQQVSDWRNLYLEDTCP